MKKTASELSETVNTVLFCPDDLNLIKEGGGRAPPPDGQRAISQIRPRYAGYLAEFNRLYEHKTRILKDWHEKPSLLETLDEFSGRDVPRQRTAHPVPRGLCGAARHGGGADTREFSGEGERLELSYKTVSTVKDPCQREGDILRRV